MNRINATTVSKGQRPGPNGSPLKRTSHGPGVAKVLPVTDAATTEDERAFMRAVVAGLADLEAGRDLSLADAKARLGLK